MTVIGGPVRRAGRIGSHEDLDRLELLGGYLRERPVDHGHVIGGGVRPGVPRAQHHRERLPRLIRIRAERVEPVPVLVVPGRPLLLGVRGDQRRVHIDRKPAGRTVQLPEPLACAGVRRAQRVQHPRLRRDPVEHPERGRVRRDRPEQRVLLPDRPEIRDALAAVGQHHREIGDHPAGIMTTTPPFDPRQPARHSAREPELVRDLPEQRGPRVRHQPRSVRRDFYRYRASVTHHPQGETSKLGIQDFSNPKNPCRAGRSRAPAHPGGAGLTAQSGLTTIAVACQPLAYHHARPSLHSDQRSEAPAAGRVGTTRSGLVRMPFPLEARAASSATPCVFLSRPSRSTSIATASHRPLGQLTPAGVGQPAERAPCFTGGVL